MTNDEREIRELVDRWVTASKAGDISSVLPLMTEDVLFMIPGVPPYGKQAYAAAARGLEDLHLEGTSDIQEIQVMGDWAYLRNHLTMAATLPDGRVIRRSGYTLTILRKEPDGKWRLSRDANLMTTDK